MPTPHNTAKKGDIAKTVLMPGDPLRAKFIAELYLDNPVQFNSVRGMLGYTGTWKGHPVSVMGSGMGSPSMGIYSYELFTEYDVDTIIRIGSCGAYTTDLKLFDIILANESYSESTYARVQSGFPGDVTSGTPAVTKKLQESADSLGIPVIQGRIHSCDVFYTQPVEQGQLNPWEIVRNEHDCLAVEMESFALFHNASVTGKQAGCLLTVSDIIPTLTRATPEEREKSFTRMMEVALGFLL